jgi:hypothetical protein
MVVPSRPSVDQGRAVAAVHDALDAWGRFAVSGELGLLEGHFDPAGPQYRQLASESERLAANPIGDPPYGFALAAEEVRGSGSTVFVVGGVTVTRPGEPEQTLRWSIEMHLIGDRWQIWTVTSEKL